MNYFVWGVETICSVAKKNRRPKRIRLNCMPAADTCAIHFSLTKPASSRFAIYIHLMGHTKPSLCFFLCSLKCRGTCVLIEWIAYTYRITNKSALLRIVFYRNNFFFQQKPRKPFCRQMVVQETYTHHTQCSKNICFQSLNGTIQIVFYLSLLHIHTFVYSLTLIHFPPSVL